MTAYNDTGSTSLTIFNTDLEYLGDLGNYDGWYEDVYIVVADGGMERLHSLWVQLRFVRGSGNVLTMGPMDSRTGNNKECR